ncbi:MAG: cysteine desulfurase family protein [Fimbriimonas sp.]
MDRARYFDNAATTPLDPRVREAMLPYLDADFGNASSIHAFGMSAHAAIERARERVAALIGAEDPSQIVFTSGATESNNWVLRSFPSGAISPFEHSAVREPANFLGYRTLANTELTLLPPDERVALVSVMSVNNEIGAQWDAREFRPFADALHSDLTQGVGKLPVDLEGLDYASLSAHKFYGPKGVGALYFADTPLPPLLMGGEQEGGLRAGTHNVAAIVGMGIAAEIAAEEWEQDRAEAERLREIVVQTLEPLSDWQINGGPKASPYILSLSFYGIEGETLVIEADRAGYAISSGAACSSRSTEPSHVLTSLGLAPEWRRGTVRISFGRGNNPETSEDLAKSLRLSVEKLRTMT